MIDSGSAGKLTVVNYAFSNVAPDASGQVVCQLGDPWADYQKPWEAAQSVSGEAVSWPNPVLGNFQQLKALKAYYPNLKVMISLGGWTWSQHFSDAVLTAESRTVLAKSCIDLFIKGDLPDPGWGGMGGLGSGAGIFDGIDIDWEWPASEGHPDNIVRPEDTKNYTALLAEFRRQLDAIDSGLMLTIAGPAAESKYSKMELNKIHRHVDFINLLSYDLHGGWETTTNHQANLFLSKNHHHKDNEGDEDDTSSGATEFSVNKSVQGYLRAGVPARKLVIGVPFYSRGWAGVTNTNNGLFQVSTDTAPGTFEAGVEDYKVVKNLLDVGYERYWDRKAKAAWLFDGNTFWTFDDPVVMCNKARYAQKKHLRGVMFWELTNDDAEGSLISAIDVCLKKRVRKDNDD